MDARRTVGFAAAAMALSGALFLATLELGVRVLRPTPRVQMVDPANSAVQVEVVDGELVWFVRDPEGDGTSGDWYRPLPCAPGAPRVAIAGDSVFDVVGPGPRDARVVWQLHRLLAEQGPALCLIDLSAPGFRPDQIFHVLKLAHAREPLDAAVVGVWKSSSDRAKWGPVWVDIGLFRKVRGKVPPPAGVPWGVHEALLAVSAAWRFGVQATAESNAGYAPPAARDYLAAASWAAEEGIDLLFFETPRLDVPFEQGLAVRAQRIAERGDATLYAGVAKGVQALGHQHEVFAEHLTGKDHEALRLDTCCHFKAEGHRLMAERMQVFLQDWQAQGEDASWSDGAR